MTSSKIVTVRNASPSEWMPQASCRNMHYETFFPNFGEGKGYEAKRICGGCPVIDLCLEYALEFKIDFGIYGGLNHRERRREKWKRNRESNA